MSIAVNHAKAREILLREAAAARREPPAGLVEEWRLRVERLGHLCPHRKSSTVVAALGTAILAKATDDRVDVYSLLDRGEAASSYSARSLADTVWAPNRAALGVDLGANGINPLNNTPFIGKTRIDEITGVRNQAGWACFIECLDALKKLPSSKEAVFALRGFILARSRSLLTPMDIDPQAGDALCASALIRAMAKFVTEDSEGGRRAQACAAALLDAVFGAGNVVVGVINDPSRRAPLDIAIADGAGGFHLALEVKDKPVLSHHITSSIEAATRNHAVASIGFLAVSDQQHEKDFDEIGQWAARHGVKLVVFLDWESFYLACKCFAPAAHDVFEGRVFRQLLARATELGVNSERLEQLAALGAQK